jgi:hypothetical protein
MGGAADGFGNPLLERLHPGDGRRLLNLPGELVWASTWMAEANEVVAPRLGLPALPLVDWPDNDAATPRGVRWKTVPLTWRAAARRFVWLDDEITETEQQWVAAHHPQPSLLHRVDPYRGLTEKDFASVRRWLDQFDDACQSTVQKSLLVLLGVEDRRRAGQLHADAADTARRQAGRALRVGTRSRRSACYCDRADGRLVNDSARPGPRRVPADRPSRACTRRRRRASIRRV